MDSKKIVFRETGVVLIGEVLCTAVMIGIFAAIGKYDTSVLLGGIAGAALATLNFFIMALATNTAADKAVQQDVKGGQALIQISYIGRMALLFILLALFAKSGKFHVLTLVLPLVFVRPTLSIAEIFKKKGDVTA